MPALGRSILLSLCILISYIIMKILFFLCPVTLNKHLFTFHLSKFHLSIYISFIYISFIGLSTLKITIIYTINQPLTNLKKSFTFINENRQIRPPSQNLGNQRPTKTYLRQSCHSRLLRSLNLIRQKPHSSRHRPSRHSRRSKNHSPRSLHLLLLHSSVSWKLQGQISLSKLTGNEPWCLRVVQVSFNWNCMFSPWCLAERLWFGDLREFEINWEQKIVKNMLGAEITSNFHNKRGLFLPHPYTKGAAYRIKREHFSKKVLPQTARSV